MWSNSIMNYDCKVFFKLCSWTAQHDINQSAGVMHCWLQDPLTHCPLNEWALCKVRPWTAGGGLEGKASATAQVGPWWNWLKSSNSPPLLSPTKKMSHCPSNHRNQKPNIVLGFLVSPSLPFSRLLSSPSIELIANFCQFHYVNSSQSHL